MLKQLGKESIIYGIGNVISKFIAVLTLPLLTRCLSVQEMGVLELLLVLQNFGVYISSGGLTTALTFYYWDAKGAEKKQKQYVTTTFLALVVSSFCMFAMLFWKKDIVEYLYLKDDFGSTYYWAITVIPVTVVFNFAIHLCRVKKKPILFNILVLLNIIFYLSVLFVALKILHHGLDYVFISRIAAILIPISVAILYFRKDLFYKFSNVSLVQEAKYGLPLVPILLFSWIMSSADRVFLLNYYDMQVIGYYSVAAKIALAVTIFIGAFNLAWGPYSMSIKDGSNAKQAYSKILTYYLGIALFIVLMVQACSPIFISIFATTEYLKVVPWIGILALASCVHAAIHILAVGLNITKKTYFISIGIGIATLSNIGLNMLLVPTYGAVGAASATVGAYCVSAISIYTIGRRHYPISYEYRKLFTIIAVFALVYAAQLMAFHILETSNYIFVAISSLISLMYVLLLSKLDIVSIHSVKNFMSFMVTRKR